MADGPLPASLQKRDDFEQRAGHRPPVGETGFFQAGLDGTGLENFQPRQVQVGHNVGGRSIGEAGVAVPGNAATIQACREVDRRLRSDRYTFAVPLHKDGVYDAYLGLLRGSPGLGRRSVLLRLPRPVPSAEALQGVNVHMQRHEYSVPEHHQIGLLSLKGRRAAISLVPRYQIRLASS